MLAQGQLIPSTTAYGPERLYRLRWRFEYATRAAKWGPWNAGSDLPSDSASRQPKDGLIRAIVEAEHRQSFQISRLVEVVGPDYASASWDGYVRAPALSNAAHMNLMPRINGLSFLTRTERVTAWVDGTVTRRPLRPDELAFDLEEHRAGSSR